jgi:hypothetical protein
MSHQDSERAVACTLTEDEEEERSEDVRELLISHYSGYQRCDDGLEIRFEGTGDALQALARFTADELQCCSFAAYDITVAPPYEETVLSVTGPEGTREMFEEGLVERLEAETA